MRAGGEVRKQTRVVSVRVGEAIARRAVVVAYLSSVKKPADFSLVTSDVLTPCCSSSSTISGPVSSSSSSWLAAC